MKSKIILKKHIASFTVVCILCVAVFVNWYYTKDSNNYSEPEVTKENNLGEAQYVNSDAIKETNNDYFINARLNREKVHAEGKESLEKIINDENSDESIKADAKGKLYEYSDMIKNESDIENLIKAETNSECIVSLNDNNISVILPKDIINENNIVKIKDIIISKTNFNSDSIIVNELK